ncbi:MAG: radical SAM protein [Candidatus Cloacimonadota bacterium]
MSRRLGVSLGVDLVPYKYCPLNCVYCEVQRTTHLQTTRQEFFPLEDICQELSAFLRAKPSLDHITFSGAGEPTLYSRIGELIAFIKTNFPGYKLALLTNGVLLDDPQLRQDVLPCDIILPSLDAVSEEIFQKLNRPKAGLLASTLVDSLISLRHEYAGKIWLEVFIIPGLNDHDEELYRLRDAIGRIKPDLVQINSLDRPGAEDWVKAADTELLSRIKDLFSETLDFPVEIIAKVEYKKYSHPVDSEAKEVVKSLLVRRPCTAEDMASILNLHINEISKILRQFSADGRVVSHREERGIFYQWKS